MPIDRRRGLPAAVTPRLAARRPIDLSVLRRPMVGAVRASLAAGLAGAAWASASAVFGPSAAAIFATVPLAVGVLLVEIERSVRSAGGVFSRSERTTTACGALAGSASVAAWMAHVHVHLNDTVAFGFAGFASLVVAAHAKRRTKPVAAVALGALAAPCFLVPMGLHVAFLPPVTIGLAIGWATRTSANGRARLPLTLLAGLLAGLTETLLMHVRTTAVPLHAEFFTPVLPRSLEEAGFAGLAAVIAAAFACSRRNDAAARILRAFSGTSSMANGAARPRPINLARIRKRLDRCKDDEELRSTVVSFAVRISVSPSAKGASAAHALLRARAARIEKPSSRVFTFHALMRCLPAGGEGAAHADLRVRASEIAGGPWRARAIWLLARYLPPGEREAIRAWRDLCTRAMLIENDAARESVIASLTEHAPVGAPAVRDRD